MAKESDEEIKRRVNELVALYSLEPNLKVLFVEEAFDRRFLRWFFREIGRADIQVCEVAVVHFANGQLESLGLERSSNKHRVIGLIQMLENSMSLDNLAVFGLVDCDSERFLGFKWQSTHLLRTDYTSLEMYFFDAPPIEKFIDLVLHGFPLNPADLLDQISPILEMAFCARLANEQLGWRCDWLDIARHCAVKHSKIEFNMSVWIERYLHKCARADEDLRRFERTMASFKRQMDADPRHQMHGHDFVSLLGYLIVKLKNDFGPFRHREILERALVGCVQLDFLQDQPLFVRLGEVF